MRVSIIIPVIRPKKAARCIQSIRENAGIARSGFEIVAGRDVNRIGVPTMVKRLVERTEHSLVCYIGDDCIAGSNFLFNALRHMECLPDGWGLVGFNDQHHDGTNMATHWLADKRLLPYLGGEFFSTAYWHCFCDAELTTVCKRLGRYVWAKDAIIYHDHPQITGVGVDADYMRVYSRRYFAHDREVYNQRLSG